MRQVDPSVMRRLRKILALTNSSEPGEAAAALHQARKLMDAHGLSSTDVEGSDIEEAQVKLGGASLPGWEEPLLHVVAHSLDVGVMIRSAVPIPGKRCKSAEVVFVGHGANAAIAQYAFTRLRAQLKKNLDALVRSALEASGHVALGRKARLPTAKIIGAPAREAYARGWCTAVVSKVSALGPNEPSASVARYVAAKTCAESAQAKSAINEKSSRANIFASAGFRDGSRVELHKAVHGAQPQAMLL